MLLEMTPVPLKWISVIQALWLVIYVAMYAVVYFFTIDKIYGLIQMAVILSIPLISMYNGQRGKNRKINKFVQWFLLHILSASSFDYWYGIMVYTK